MVGLLQCGSITALTYGLGRLSWYLVQRALRRMNQVEAPWEQAARSPDRPR